MNTESYQDGSDRVEQISYQHRPESITRDAKWSCGTRMEGPTNMGPLALEADTEHKVRVIQKYLHNT